MKFPRVLSEMEIAKMLKAAETSPRDLMMLKCLYYLGLKSGELRSLKVHDIDFEENVIRIPGKNERYVMIPGAFTFELEEYVKGMEGIIFKGRGSGGTLSDRHVRRMVKGYARMADVRNYEEIKPHTLRISYATHLRKDGVPAKTIQAMLGHSRRETTYMYTHGMTEPNRSEPEK